MPDRSLPPVQRKLGDLTSPSPEDGSSGAPQEITSVSLLLARLTWALAGPLALLGIAYGILSSGSGWLTGLDIAFAVVVGLMLLSRWLERRAGTLTTLSGQRARPDKHRRYTLGLVLVAALVWVGTNLVGNHVLA